MASLMPDKIVEATGIDRSHILTGLFTDTSVVGDDNDINRNREIKGKQGSHIDSIPHFSI